jgi:hypothetical protein
VRALKLADGRTIALTDVQVSKSLRENLRQSACARFTTVLGNGADAYHESHVHLDLLERSNKYRICQWDVLDVAESAALAAKKAIAAAVIASDVPLPRPRPVAALAAKKVIAAAVIASDVSLPRPRPVLNHDISTLSQRRHEHFREAGRGSVFDFMTSLLRYAR